ncbi:MAG TPA: metal-sulfur cluster assembly factor [Longimicrobiales bacterium]|nr:metal-sulfur cluster assembly factor [Longimicrobiales bacterium]
MTDFAGDVVRQVLADGGSAPDPPESARRWHAAVLAASARTTHELKAGDSPRDPRYRSDDSATDALWRALCEVADPELPISLVDLGLICDVRRRDADVEVDLTFTASACPCMEFIIEDVRERLLREPGVQSVAVRDVWDPPWTTDRMTDHGRALLRSFGVAA